jgi:hypothetical protein
MNGKPTYEELETRVRELERAAGTRNQASDPLQVVLIGIEKLAAPYLDPSHKQDLITLMKKHTLRMMELSSKIQKISQYATKGYVRRAKKFLISMRRPLKIPGI